MNVMGLNEGLLLVLWSIMKMYQVFILLSKTIFSSFLGGVPKIVCQNPVVELNFPYWNWRFDGIYIYIHTIFSHT